MIDLGGVTAQAVRLALDVSVLRHHVIANNIANVHSPGFTPQRVSFEDTLDAARAALRIGDSEESLRAELVNLEQRVAGSELIVPDGGDSVEIDIEMTKLADNTLRYRALLAGLGKRMAILNSAVREGR